ncbi:FG-GAP-like repeat-containing protein [Streptomyces sp. NBC_00829]|uniref:FG-GAP-like repeat-containing protein n=1 Tax=Streptomyces sp. NBC_00829 TaxID=2903679 RepID=UPI00386D5C95|nr:FG-GAP-like repeat-containing protein [Streptomyces sp. NBC_00829]
MLETTRRKRALAAAVVTASLATLITQAPGAVAAENSARCPAGKFCVFTGGGYTGDLRIYSSSQPTLGTWNDKISSVVNNSGLWATLYVQPHYGTSPDYVIVGPHNGPIDLSDSFDRQFGNKISSMRVTTTEFEAVQGVPWMDWYQQPEIKRPAGLPAVAQFGDLDNNGSADVLERANDGRLWFLSGVGDANGTTKGKLVGGGWNAMSQLVRHGDYNADGREDLFARDTSGVLWFYPGRGNGTFGTRVRIGTGWNAMREINAAGDLTGDGRRDLLARDSSGTLWTYPGNGKGAFGARKKVGAGWGVMNRLTSPGDLTGDGRADLLARDGARALWLYPGNGSGAFGVRKKLPYAWPADEPVMSVGDVNGDGLSDIMRPIDYQLFVYQGDGRSGISGPNADMLWDTAPNVRAF